MFEIFQICTKYNKLEQIPPFPHLKHLQAMIPSFVTIIKLSSNKMRETFFEGLK